MCRRVQGHGGLRCWAPWSCLSYQVVVVMNCSVEVLGMESVTLFPIQRHAHSKLLRSLLPVSWCGQFPILSFPFNRWTPQPFLFSIIGHPDPILSFSRERFSSCPALQISNLALLDPRDFFSLVWMDFALIVLFPFLLGPSS